jgi:flagellar protein FliS
MYSQRAAAQYRSVTSHGQVADASPVRLVQIVFEHILSNLATAQGAMARIRDNMPFNEVLTKSKAMSKAIRLLGHLDSTLDMERGQDISRNLHNLYAYMLDRLTVANVHNNAALVGEVVDLVQKIKTGWDKVVETQ